MLIEKVMISPVYTLTESDSIKDAIHLMQTHKIRHIPIVDEHDHLVGIVTDRDIRSAVPSTLTNEQRNDIFDKPLNSIMTKDVITAHPLDFVEEASILFYRHQIGCLPIVSDNRLVGILTETDVLKTFIELTGAHQPGSQLEVRVENRPGTLEKIVHIISEKQINILSTLIYPDDNSYYKIIVLRIQTINPLPVVEELRKNGFEVLWPKGALS